MRHLSSLIPSGVFSSLVPSAACAAAIALFASSASAHIELVEPLPRYTLPSNKSCPCGDGDSNRTCDVPAAQSTDPNRSTKVATFEAGETITVVAEEYIDHDGRMRVAFDPDGADLADFNDNILMDVADPSEAGLSMANPHVWEFQIQLPNMTCDNCTLQVIQVMNGNTTTPVMDPAPLSTYYSCADIRLVAAGSLGEGGTGSGGTGSGGSATAGQAGGPSASGSGGAATSGGTGGASAGGAPAAGGSGSVDDADDEEEDDSGCSFRASAGSSAAGWALALLGLAAAVRRRRAS